MNKLSKYEKDYSSLPFENILRKYRIKNLCAFLNVSPHQNILDIGCGNDPIYTYFNDFTKVTVIEPGQAFYKNAQKLAKSNSKIQIVNDFVENTVDLWKSESFDFIIIGGFLHEIHNPDEVLAAINKISSNHSLVYSYVPNSKSFHRLLAFEMSITDSIYQKSGHDKLFNRQNNFDLQSFNELLEKNGFQCIDKGSYFVKPFTHNQMGELIKKNIFDSTIFDGLDKMIKYLPEFGSELYVLFKLNDQINRP